MSTAKRTILIAGMGTSPAEHVGEVGCALLSATVGDFGEGGVGVFDEVLPS